jgi:hypothetical protein
MDDLPPQLDLQEIVDGPFVVTFTAYLPFPTGVPNELGHLVALGEPFADAEAQAVFKQSWVNIRLFEVTKPGLPAWRSGVRAAMQYFYEADLDLDDDGRYGEEEYLERHQWVTLETPHAQLVGENPTDAAFAFHRSLNVFNYFLRATLLVTRDVRIRPISSHDFRPAVFIGARPEGQPWRLLSTMYMHPEAMPEGLIESKTPMTGEQLNSALHAMATQKPYLTTAMWRSRAQRALRQTGDAADAVISFQVAAESMLFDTYRMLLVDEGRSSAEIDGELSGEIPFKTLLTKKLHGKLGGQWDITLDGTPIADYWKDLYLVRNSIIHTGMQAHGGHAQCAQDAYRGMQKHLEERLWAKHKSYPRTLLARIGEERLEQLGWLTKWVRASADQFKTESQPFYWPYDLAGR